VAESEQRGSGRDGQEDSNRRDDGTAHDERDRLRREDGDQAPDEGTPYRYAAGDRRCTHRALHKSARQQQDE
jgi:hypothetical protein